MLLQNAAAGGSLLAAEAAGLLSGECGEYGGEDRAVSAERCGRFGLILRCMATAVSSVFNAELGFVCC